MKQKAFTLMEMIAVLAVMSILILIIFPVMRDVLYDFEEKSNKQVYEQLYKSAKLFYAEKRNNINERLEWQAPTSSCSDVGYTGDPCLPNVEDMYEKTWGDVAPTYFATNVAWSCVDTGLLVQEGYLKKINLDDVKSRLGFTNQVLYVVIVGEPQNGDKRVIRIKDNALMTTITNSVAICRNEQP